MSRTPKPLSPDRQQALYRAALREFEKGFEVASLNAILREAGFSKSSFYHYFSNKDELFNVVASAALQAMHSRIPDIHPYELTTESFWAGASTFFAAVIDSLGEGSALLWLLESSGISPEHNENSTWLYEILDALVNRGRKLGVLDSQVHVDLHLSVAQAAFLTVCRWIHENDMTPKSRDVARLVLGPEPREGIRIKRGMESLRS